MRKTFAVSFLIFMIIGFMSCEDDTFSTPIDFDAFIGELRYSETKNAREFSKIESGAPTLASNGYIPFFEIVSIKNGEGKELGEEFLKDVDIVNVSESRDTIVQLNKERDSIIEEGLGEEFIASIPNYKFAGNIIIREGNIFSNGKYSFSIRTTIEEEDGREITKVHEDVYVLSVGPALVEDLLYSPIAQNLVVGNDEFASTTKPYLLTGNEDVVFKLGDNEDKLKINSNTGEISLNEAYQYADRDTIFPTVHVVSNISDEQTTFKGEDFLMIVISDSVLEMPKKTINFFYPTFEAQNTQYGYKVDVINDAGIQEGKIWWKQNPSPMAAAERPSEVGDVFSLMVNAVVGGASLPHESDLIINTQDLTKYGVGYDLTATFYTYNNYILYKQDGTTPTSIEVYISTDYDGDNDSATWVHVNDDVHSQIQGKEDVFEGMPYPGQNTGPDPEGVKDPEKNNYGKWVKSILDLNPYDNESKFTLKFKFKSHFKGEVPVAQPPADDMRSGRWQISDVHFQAKEKSQ